MRMMPVERITGVISNLIYGTIFTNYFSGQRHSPAQQAQDIFDIVFHGILVDRECEQAMRDDETASAASGPRRTDDSRATEVCR